MSVCSRLQQRPDPGVGLVKVQLARPLEPHRDHARVVDVVRCGRATCRPLPVPVPVPVPVRIRGTRLLLAVGARLRACVPRLLPVPVPVGMSMGVGCGAVLEEVRVKVESSLKLESADVHHVGEIDLRGCKGV